MFRGFVSKWTASLRPLLGERNSKPATTENGLHVKRLRIPAATKRDNKFDPTNFVSARTNDSAKTGLAFETTTVLSPMNLSGTTRHAHRVDPKVR